MDAKTALPRYIEYTYSHSALKWLLVLVSYFSVALTAAAFILTEVGLLLADPWRALGVALVCAVPYALVSLFRRWFDAPRPYELYDLSSVTDSLPHSKAGRSFPSRHVFSAFVIGTVLAFIAPLAGIAVCLFGAALAASRVLLGIHFLRDVVAGALIGIISGILGTLIVNFGLLAIV